MQHHMTAIEVQSSALLGNRIARKIANGNPFKANAAIRHAMATEGNSAAMTLATNLLGLSIADAYVLVGTLAKTKPDDIVSPHM